MPGVPDLTDVARSSLLDALEALEQQKDALVVVGAQAIYLRIGEAYAAVAPFTTDGDLLIDPAFLADDPKIATLMEAGGFRLVDEDVGVWTSATTGVTIDLLVPEAVGGAGRRGARLGIHGKRVAKKVAGLEGALVDRDRMTVGSPEPDDSREFDMLVVRHCSFRSSSRWQRGETSRGDSTTKMRSTSSASARGHPRTTWETVSSTSSMTRSGTNLASGGSSSCRSCSAPPTPWAPRWPLRQS
jgi:hypothetical protein